MLSVFSPSTAWRLFGITLWAFCLFLLGLTSNAEAGIQFTWPVVNSVVHCVAYGLSVFVARWLADWSRLLLVRGVLWTVIIAQWVGLALLWLLCLVTDFPTPLAYFTSISRWQTDKLLYYRGQTQLVTQHLEPKNRVPTFPADPTLPMRMPDTERPAYPPVRTVMIEPVLPGLQRVSCYNYSTTPNCGCCGWEDKLDASWTLVDTLAAGLRYSSDSTVIKLLLAQKRALNTVQTSQEYPHIQQ